MSRNYSLPSSYTGSKGNESSTSEVENVDEHANLEGVRSRHVGIGIIHVRCTFGMKRSAELSS